MKSQTILLAGLAAIGLAGCSSEPEPEVEKIVVREPGDPPVQSSAGSSEDMVAAGKAAFAICAACHNVGAGAASGAGPHLNAIIGRTAGSLDDFAYSDAMAASGITWDEVQLKAFIADPTGVIPGTTMVSGAVEDAEQRAAIIAYLASLES
ncbi:cytochrome c family protein [Erythrobacter sp. YT30]|uniref:c-type cytochrome n=1 Tax=Erythrobacter sp. YT30 TaxID=1735012 RepID=UPI000831C33F|nr:c-type cytochrome [Erythrobacter sp. YT30]